MTDRLLTPSKITAWLDCTHFLTLKHRVEDGLLAAPGGAFGSFAQLLAEKGLQHEAACLAQYEAAGKRVLRIPDRQRGERFTDWVDRVGDPFSQGYDVIYQMPFIHAGVRGIADFLERVQDEDGVISYEPVDAKLARVEAKPGHVLQLCFYVDAIEAVTGTRPSRMHLWLGSGRVETLTVAHFAPYWNRLRRQLARVLEIDTPDAATTPEPCDHCAFCEFFETCTDQWRGEDALIYVAGMRAADHALLRGEGISTLAGLAAHSTAVGGIRPDRLARLVSQAELQVEARLHEETSHPPYRMTEPNEDPVWGRGFEQLPEPDDGDVFLDFEGHPFWRADAGLFFLFGLIERDADETWSYRTWWAHDLDEESTAAAALIDYLADRRRIHPHMHVYHYNHTERSSLERLAREHGTGETTLAHLVETGLFIDLLLVARNAMQVGTESYGLKHLERLTSFERGHDIDQGAGAVVEYEHYMADPTDGVPLVAIAAYNEDDVRATMALRDWLVEHRPIATAWRTAVLTPDEVPLELNEQAAALHAFGPGTTEHFLGDVLGYWRREWLANLAPKLARCAADLPTLLDDPEALAGLTPLGVLQRVGAKGQPITPAMRFSLPTQETGGFTKGNEQVVFTTDDGPTGYSTVCRLDPAGGEVELLWSEEYVEQALDPTVVVLNDWVPPKPKPDALSELAARVLDATGPQPNPAGLALLERRLPAFTPGGGPPDGVFGDDLEEMKAWVTQLDHSFVAVQGPPGTGKTYRAAHLVHTLILGGKRVGITAMSHHAIDNLLQAIVDVFTEAGQLDVLNAVRRGAEPETGGLASVTYAGSNGPCKKAAFNLVAGTTWLFAGKDMNDAPVDVLFIDEAGQLALADALAASRSAHNLVILGDPLQLPQVAQAAHPDGSGRSVLEHVIADDITIPASHGVFLTETRRMHPDICSFISAEIYQSRLTNHTSCNKQTTAHGTGLRWLQTHHEQRTTESPEEAELVAEELERLIGTSWTDKDGHNRLLQADDFMVVAPYNDQVNLLRARLAEDERTRGVPVGTVDRFQGREAPVVFFTMTTSSGADAPRGADFLFSRNRLNVAVSRARCLAYLVCTEELLNSRAHSVEEMRLISTLCAFVESSAPSKKGPEK